MAGPQSWHTVRQWLLDLARALEVGLRDGSLESLAIDRIWTTADGRAKLLDFRAPGGPASSIADLPASTDSAQCFLASVSRRALDASAVPPPLSASDFLRSLDRQTFTTLPDIVKALEELVAQPDRVTQRQRGMALALGFLVFWFGAGVVWTALASGPLGSWVREISGRFGLAPRHIADLGSALLGVLWACVLGSGFWLWAFRIAVVTPDGRQASRLRATGRAVLAWSWVPIQVLALAYGWIVISGALGLVKLIGLAWAVDHPERGPHDRLAGTYLVPR
jgi:hypothetical protein